MAADLVDGVVQVPERVTDPLAGHVLSAEPSGEATNLSG
jgi:hypothetical protein